jgi:hypothetical protein
MEAFVYFLKTGSLPWSFRLPKGVSLEQAMIDVLSDPVAADVVRRVLGSEAERKRLTLQFSKGFLEAMLLVLAPEAKLVLDRVLHLLRDADGTVVETETMTFTTKKQPLGFSLAANPNPVTWGTGTTLAGQLIGTGNAGRTVKLQQNAFPYTSKFADVGNPLVTDGNGNFGFFVPLLTVTTQFRVATVGSPSATSPVVIVGSAVRVGAKANHTRVHRGGRVRFSGFVTPANDGALFAVQRLKGSQWVTVQGGSLRHFSTQSSHYRKTLHIRHFGKYRVFVGVNNQNTSGISRAIRIRQRG